MQYTLKDFLISADSKKISAHYNSNNSLVGFKYTPETVYSRNWDEVSLLSRGITFDTTTGEIVAFPFKKFFNFDELYDSNLTNTKFAESLPSSYRCSDLSGKFRVTEKYDGSLGIAFNYKDKWIVKTSGSFDSEQAKWATEFLVNHCNTEYLDKNCTYCFEIIYNEDVHPIHYDFEGLVLLAVIDKFTGIEKPFEEVLEYEKFGFRIAKTYKFSNFSNVMKFAKKLDNKHEGVVVTFEDGWKTKIKGEEFLKLQKLFHNITKEEIWKNFNPMYMKYDNFEFIMSIPEELKEMKSYVKELPEMFDRELERLRKIANNMDRSKDRKGCWKDCVEKTENKFEAGVVMKMLEGNSSVYYDMIKKMLKP
jgi:hypothetical protein